MSFPQLLLTALTLVVTVLAGPSFAGTRCDLAAVETTPGTVHLGKLDTPAFLFSHRRGRLRAAKRLRVRAMAYTCGSRRSKRPPRGAWGDPLTPGIKAVAVSRDLLKMGLGHGDTIRIEGLPGKYRVLDVMHKRHSRAIDIYYGNDRRGALRWGARKRTITWKP